MADRAGRRRRQRGREPRTRRDVRDVIAAKLAAENSSRLLYGAVVTAAALAVVDGYTETGVQVLLEIAGVLVVYWIAHVYVEVLADRLVSSSHRPRLKRALHHEA